MKLSAAEAADTWGMVVLVSLLWVPFIGRKLSQKKFYGFTLLPVPDNNLRTLVQAALAA